MLRSLHTKLVLIMILQVVCLMTIAGAFLINSVNRFYLNEFYNQMVEVFSKDTEFVRDLVTPGEGETDGVQAIDQILVAKMGPLGVDGKNRNYYILDGGDGSILTSSDDEAGQTLDEVTPNLLIALNEKREGTESDFTANYMDLALPITRGDSDYIIYILDQRASVRELNSQLFQLIIEALAFGLIISVLLSFLLSRAMVNPIRALTRGVKRVADGDFSREIHSESHDEIGVLTTSFNAMASQLQRTLREVESERTKLSTLFLHMTDGVAAFTTDGTLIHMNPATENLLGVRVEQKLSFDEMFADLDMPDTDETVSRSFLTNEITRFGRVLSVTLAPYGALDGEGGVIAVIHDVTEQRRLDDARREFVANVSHELRTPLTNIRSYTETLLDAAGELPLDTEKQFLGVISSESERMARIVTDLLTLSKLDYGRMELRMTRFSVSDLLKKVTNAMKLTAEDSGHMILVETEPNLPPMVGDRERIEQVVVNILSNAVKYTPSGGRIRLTAQRAGANHVRVTVEDNGVGIPADDVPRLFERFYRVDKARSRAAGGTGLGLAIAKEIVEQHEGKIALTSEYGKGTTVTITLPTDLKPHGREDKV